MTCKRIISSLLMPICIFFSATAKTSAGTAALATDYVGANIIYRDDSVIDSTRFSSPALRTVWSYLRRQTSKWDTSVSNLPSTSEGIEVEYAKHDKSSTRVTDMIIYTIPEGYSGDIMINATEDIFRTIGGIYQPGEQVSLTIRIINNSDNQYAYASDTFIISTENYSQYTLASSSDAYGFDGSPVLLGHTTKRSGNTAIAALYEINSTSDLTQQQIRDTSLSPLLKELGYENGIQDLDLYYLDFYNKKYNLSAKKLEDFPDQVILELFSGENLREVETCTQVAALGYNWFYNRLLSAVPDNQKYSDESTEYTIGSYMRSETSYEDYCQAAFSDIATNTYTLQPIHLHFNKTYMGDAYRDINLNLCIGFQLKQQ